MENPTPTASNTVSSNLNALLDNTGGSSARPYATLVGHNMGSNTLLMSFPMRNFFEISEVANATNIRDKEYYQGEEVAQRKLDPTHARSLAVYILKGLFNSLKAHYLSQGKGYPNVLDEMIEKIGRQPYLALQPITANIRRCKPQGEGLDFEKAPNGKMIVYLSDLHVLWVVDGQHRRHAMNSVFKFLRDLQLQREYPKKTSLYPAPAEAVPSNEMAIWNDVLELATSKCTVVVEVHLGLNPEQERQLFHDLNNLTKKVEKTLAYIFDSSNPVNLFIKETLKEENVLKAEISDTDRVDWHDDKGEISWKDLIAVNARLFLNKNNITGASPAVISERKDVAVRFWETIGEIPDFGEPGSKRKTVIAQPVVLKALAKLIFDFKWGKKADEAAYEKLIENMNDIDFSQTNEMWRYYSLDLSVRDEQLPGLADYLPKSDGSNRDIGAWDQDSAVIRFGSKSNDIFPIIGDMIRWKLQLPNRHGDILAGLEV